MFDRYDIHTSMEETIPGPKETCFIPLPAIAIYA